MSSLLKWDPVREFEEFDPDLENPLLHVRRNLAGIRIVR